MSNTIETFIHAARERLAQQTAAHAASWHLGEEADRAADHDFRHHTAAKAKHRGLSDRAVANQYLNP
ncbi:MAG: hypothetical protein LBE30_00805 [Comamonas sp.]|nr:hypothetical protein [Comamonas sp.]